ncbi:TPA: class II fructose-bisphosphate aldolase [Listeria innocua]|uniref:class II fructose-bisphosphate aldolase n=1 Tax=Listeria innocua TaxID=1642 RepID=UPI000FC28233|nr:ketose-bisphosphate aldolase [Listeria innocua]EAD5841029.1 ketose-bisphosphate aldolase [Listeria innocua]EAG8542139.1 ketose-bisphosphate aldolase [Listeria innocua]EDO1187561.1 ketose-bisphosphate aldolase [Listeria innocua]EKY3975292.1 ketose-bisphosphate aldolase [Listeria innocua]MDH4576347.1 ketose-bisphosphate aldolase [Listeria innocua]
MYVSMKGILKRANEGRYAVMAINCFNLETARAVIDAAQELRAPIIIDLLQDHLTSHLGSRFLTRPIIKMAEEASVEVAINLDHGQDVAIVKQCLEDGFSSVMMDASSYPYEENVAITKKMVEFAETYNASVEAEVGNIGAVTGENYTNQAMYTDPKIAIDFANKTGIDALAISYGSSHGDYPEGFTPAFQFDIVREIKAATNMPLVLHGGSGCGEENILESIRLGINKINVGSDFMKAQVDKIKTNLEEKPMINYVDLISETITAGKEVVKYYIQLSGSTGKLL